MEPGTIHKDRRCSFRPGEGSNVCIGAGIARNALSDSHKTVIIRVCRIAEEVRPVHWK